MEITFTVIFVVIVLVIIILISEINNKRCLRSKTSFERGFLRFNKSRRRFSLRIYFILFIFLIFDLELNLLLPFIYFLFVEWIIHYLICFLLVMVLILLTTFLELKENSFNWQH